MKKSEFTSLCGMPDNCRDFKIKKAVEALLKELTDRTLTIPEEKYFVKGAGTPEEQLIEYLQGEENVTVNYNDENDRESYIASIRLDADDEPIIRVYDYYACEFREVGIYALNSVRDAMSFVLEYAEFDKETTSPKTGVANLTDLQLEALDRFLDAARELNYAGASLLWDEDDNCLRVVNRDVMKDNSFWRLEPREESPEGSLLLSGTATNALGIEIPTVSRDCDLYFFPEN